MSATESGLNLRRPARCPLCHEVHDADWGQRRCERHQATLRRIQRRDERRAPRQTTGPDGKVL